MLTLKWTSRMSFAVKATFSLFFTLFFHVPKNKNKKYKMVYIITFKFRVNMFFLTVVVIFCLTL